VGAIIEKDGKILMVGNEDVDYLYSVGGRIQFGETAQQAVVREVWEETGVTIEVERLAFVEENYFYADTPSKMGKVIYEIGYYFYMKVPQDFSPVCRSATADDQKEFLRWVSAEDKIRTFPDFFTYLPRCSDSGVQFFSNDDR
jgi:8-oxo-dGTP pyrophosphatase MutT (NUDIX family)